MMKKRFILILTITLLLLLNSLTSIAYAKKPTAQRQIAIAMNAVMTAENMVKKSDFDTTRAKKQVNLANQEIARIKGYGSNYSVYEQSLVKRLNVVKREISEKEKADVYKNEGIGFLSVENTQNIVIEDDTFKTADEISKLLSFLNGIKGTKIKGDAYAKALAPAGGANLAIVVNLKNNSKIAKDVIVAFRASYLIETAYDKFNHMVYKRYYTPETNLMGKVLNLSDELNLQLCQKKNLQVFAINPETIDSVAFSNFIGHTTTYRDKTNIEKAVSMLKALSLKMTENWSSNNSTMQISIVYKGDFPIRKTIFYMTDNVMKYKAYDELGNLLAIGFYEVDKNILSDIERMVIK